MELVPMEVLRFEPTALREHIPRQADDQNCIPTPSPCLVWNAERSQLSDFCLSRATFKATVCFDGRMISKLNVQRKIRCIAATSLCSAEAKLDWEYFLELFAL